MVSEACSSSQENGEVFRCRSGPESEAQEDRTSRSGSPRQPWAGRRIADHAAGGRLPYHSVPGRKRPGEPNGRLRRDLPRDLDSTRSATPGSGRSCRAQSQPDAPQGPRLLTPLQVLPGELGEDVRIRFALTRCASSQNPPSGIVGPRVGKKRASDMSRLGHEQARALLARHGEEVPHGLPECPCARSDQACSAGVSGKVWPARSAAKARKAVVAACATRSGRRGQIGRGLEVHFIQLLFDGRRAARESRTFEATGLGPASGSCRPPPPTWRLGLSEASDRARLPGFTHETHSFLILGGSRPCLLGQ